MTEISIIVYYFFKEPKTSNEEFINTSNFKDKSKIDEIPVTSHIYDGNKTKSEYSLKWKSIVGNQFMSDITIFTKEECEIPAHILVFHVQCPDILDDIIIEESDTLKFKKLIMWLEYSYEACLAFLEFIYSGQESFISHEHRVDYLNLVKRYNISFSINSCDKNEFVSKNQDKVTKRKGEEYYNSPFDCKRYKASSPDLFMSEDENVNFNFLGTAVNDEKSLSTFKTKQWLLNCNLSQPHQHSSFTENLVINVSPQNNLPENSPSHSFHSASTVSLKSNHIDCNLDPKMNCAPDIKFSSPKSSIEELGVNTIPTCDIDKKISNILETILKKNNPLPTSEKPEIITLDSDSECESINMILNSNIEKPGNSSSIMNINPVDAKNYTFLPKSSTNNTLFNSFYTKGAHVIDTIDLNDESNDSIHSVSTNILNQTNYNNKLCGSWLNNSMSASRSRTIITDDDSSMFSSVTNVKSIYDKEGRESSNNTNNNDNVINLTEDNSSDSVSTIAITGSSKNNIPALSMQTSVIYNAQHNCQNSSTSFSNLKNSERDLNPTSLNYELNDLNFKSLPSKKNLLSNSSSLYSEEDWSTNIKTNKYINSDKSSNEQSLLQIKDFKLLCKPLKQSFQQNNVSSTFLCKKSRVEINKINNNDNSNIFTNENNLLDKHNSDSESIENTILKTGLILPSNSFGDSLNTKDIVDINSCLPTENIEGALIKPINTHVESIQVSDMNNTSKITIPDENNYDQLDKSGVEQLIDDPWIDYDDYNDLQSNNYDFNLINPQHISPISSKNNFEYFENETKEKTPTKILSHSNLDLQTPSSISNYSKNTNSQKKNSATPNKYGCIVNTPKSLRKTRSESVIVSKVTPLPDYSAMKTPDLRVSINLIKKNNNSCIILSITIRIKNIFIWYLD